MLPNCSHELSSNAIHSTKLPNPESPIQPSNPLLRLSRDLPHPRTLQREARASHPKRRLTRHSPHPLHARAAKGSPSCLPPLILPSSHPSSATAPRVRSSRPLWRAPAESFSSTRAPLGAPDPPRPRHRVLVLRFHMAHENLSEPSRCSGLLARFTASVKLRVASRSP